LTSNLQPPTSNFQTAAAGFTFIEVILVTILLAILLTTAMPKFQQTAQRLRLEQGTFELAQLLRYARERAIAEGRTMIWAWDHEARQASVQPEAEDGGDGAAAEDQDAVRWTRSGRLPAGSAVAVAVGEVLVDCACIRFFADGTADPVEVAIVDGMLRLAITVKGPTGEVRVATGPLAR
jgi:type II secretion system protein H